MAKHQYLITLIVYKPLIRKFNSWTIPQKPQWGRKSSQCKYHIITQSIENIYQQLPVAVKIHENKSFYLFSINVKYSQNSGQLYLITPRRNLRLFPFFATCFQFCNAFVRTSCNRNFSEDFTRDGIKEL